MTISMFDTYLERMHLHRTERVMDMSQAALYGQLTNQSRQKMWNSWSMAIARINSWMIHRSAAEDGKNPLTWNGQLISIKGLFAKFGQTLGKESVKA